MISESLLRLLLTIIFGAILGIETETRVIEKKGQAVALKDEKSRIGGFRTYAILSLFGGITGLIFQQGSVIIPYITFAGLILLVIVAYIENVNYRKAFGMTTEFAIIITFIIGFLTTSQVLDIQVVIFILVILAFFLSQKRGLGGLIHKIKHDEIIDILKFGLTALVILPLLPNTTVTVNDLVNIFEMQSFTLNKEFLEIDVINPYTIWLIVVIISGINLAGYLLSKYFGEKRGLLLTAFFGGIVSSTSTTYALAVKSKKVDDNQGKIFAGAAIIANAVSFISVSILISILSIEFFNFIIVPIIVMFAIGIISGVLLVLNSEKKADRKSFKIAHESFSIVPAIKFVLVIVFLTIFIQILKISNSEFLATSVTAISGSLGLDAPTVAIIELFKNQEFTLTSAALLFLLTNFVNFIAKMVIGYINGSKIFRNYLSVGLIITALGSLLIFII